MKAPVAAPARAKAVTVAPARRAETIATPTPIAAKPVEAKTKPVVVVARAEPAPIQAAPRPAPVAVAVPPPLPPAAPEVAPPRVEAPPPSGFAAPEQAAAPAPPAPSPPPHYHSGPVPRVMQRPMAAAETFIAGDHVVYPTHGVGKVERIATEEIAGHKLELIHITFEENRMTLRVPVAKARTAGLRKLASRDLFDKALDVLRGRARIKRTMWSRRAQEYEAKINSGDPLAIAEVVRDLHRNAGQPDQSFSERQIYENAMDRLGAELAALDQTDKASAAVKLAEFLKTV
ncbi:MAG: CarD family transcriptional regulator [Acetobacteraceae bacterium]